MEDRVLAPAGFLDAIRGDTDERGYAGGTGDDTIVSRGALVCTQGSGVVDGGRILTRCSALGTTWATCS